MAKDFKSTISELWTLLRLAPPRFGVRNEMKLSGEDINVRLVESDDGRHLLVIGQAGRLSSEPMRRAEQVRSLLQDNLAFLPVRRACVCVASGQGDAPLVEVRGVHAYGSRLALLSTLIEDVLFLQERHSAELQRAFGSTPKQRVSLQPYERHDVIFHP